MEKKQYIKPIFHVYRVSTSNLLDQSVNVSPTPGGGQRSKGASGWDVEEP